jgi:hypothetical protein
MNLGRSEIPQSATVTMSAKEQNTKAGNQHRGRGAQTEMSNPTMCPMHLSLQSDAG